MDLAYTTVKRLRAEGFSGSDLPIGRAEEVIAEASGILSDVLDQWYIPIRIKKRLDGAGSSLAYFPNRIPFLEVLSLEEEASARPDGRGEVDRVVFLAERNWSSSYSADDFVMRGRYLELLYSSFSNGRGNVIVDCYTGWLDEFTTNSRSYTPRKTEHSTAAIVSHLGKQVELDSVEDLKVRDVVLFEANDSGRELLATAIVIDIDVSGKIIKFDRLKTLNEADIPTGSKVISFGSVPRLIERATILLVKKLQAGINSEDYDDQVFGSRLKSEKTDRYQYTLFGDKDGGGIGLTGDPIVDSQLHKFGAPLYVDLV